MSFEEQKELRKVLVEPHEGDTTDYESDQESVQASKDMKPQYDII